MGKLVHRIEWENWYIGIAFAFQCKQIQMENQGDTSRLPLCAVQVLKIRQPRTDKIVTKLQCLYLINGKVK